MPTHPIDATSHRLWTLAAGLPDYVKADWKTVNAVVVAHCYGKGTRSAVAYRLARAA